MYCISKARHEASVRYDANGETSAQKGFELSTNCKLTDLQSGLLLWSWLPSRSRAPISNLAK